MPAGTITNLKAQINDPQRVNIFIDGEFALGVSLNTVSRTGLYVGKALDQAEFDKLAQLESDDKAFQAALRLLEQRPRSVAELRTRLGRKEYAPTAIDAALERLAQLGLVDDAAFARRWVEHRQAMRPRGAGALRDELRRKGIAPDLAAHVLSDQALVGDEGARALELARATLHKYAGAADRSAFTRRLGGFLQRRGFSFDVIRPIVDQLWAELGAADSDSDEIDL